MEQGLAGLQLGVFALLAGLVYLLDRQVLRQGRILNCVVGRQMAHEEKGDEIMATLEELKSQIAANDALVVETGQKIVNGFARLEAQLQSDGHSSSQTDAILASLKAEATAMTAWGQKADAEGV